MTNGRIVKFPHLLLTIQSDIILANVSLTYTAGYDGLYTELTGTVAIYLEEHGI